VRVYVARHGETTWNVAGRYQGRRESDLSALGVAQANALAAAMREAGARAVVSSPLRRCLATARPAAETIGTPVQIDERLIEIAHGTWEGRYRDEIAANDPDRYRTWRSDPAHVAFENGETIADVLARWRSFAAAPRPPLPTLVVTHDAVVRVALCEATAGGDLTGFWDARVQNGGYVTFEVHDGRWTLVEECAAAHLAGITAPIETQAL